MSKIEALDPGGTFEVHATYVPLDFFDAAMARGGFNIVEADPAEPSAAPHTIRLSTNGLSQALEELARHCAP